MEHTYTHKFDMACEHCENVFFVRTFSRSSSGMEILYSNIYCPKCSKNPDKKIDPDPIEEWIRKVGYLMLSPKKKIARVLEESEMIMKHGVYAWWLHVDREIRLAPHISRKIFLDSSVIEFERMHRSRTMVLAYLPNNYLQPLYFMIPKDAIR
jgi:hypothetical protein